MISYLSNLFFIYLIGYLMISERRQWNIFTRLISTINSIQCIYMIIYTMYDNSYNILPLDHLYYFPKDYQIHSLFYFSSYLFVDGIFCLFNESFNFSTLLSLLHHFVGAYGIYLIAENRLGFFLGFYFAMTEFSTFFLNISWYIRRKYLFYLFYISFITCRILTIPILLRYITNNDFYLMFLPDHHKDMVIYGSYVLIFLNVTWYIIMTLKIVQDYLSSYIKRKVN